MDAVIQDSAPVMDPQSLVSAMSEELAEKQTTIAHAGVSGGFRQIAPSDKATPAAANFTEMAALLTKLAPANARAAPKRTPKLPTQLGPFVWNPITFQGFETHGHAELTLFEGGEYEFRGSFVDPSAWDYDDALVWGVVSSKGALFTFSHSGSMHGWFDRWIEGGSDTDTWQKAGSNPQIKAHWADLCAGLHYQANAAINWDIAGLGKMVEDLLKAIETVAEVIAVVV